MFIKKRSLSVVAFMVAVAVMLLLAPNVNTYASNTNKIKSVAIRVGNKTVTKKTISLTAGKNTSLKVSVKPAKAKKSISFKSGKPAVAKVSSKGKITAKKAGTSKITVTVLGKNGKKKTTYVTVKVTPKTIVVKSVSAKISKSQLTVDETARITAEVLPKNATNKTLTYTSSNQKVASVDKSGKVTAKGAGTAKITVKASNGKSAEIEITVLEKYSEKVEVHEITDGDNRIYGKLYAPAQEGTWPAVIMCHGYNGVGTDFTTECTYFAQNGYVAYAFDFCGGSVNSKSSGKSTDMTIFTEKENLIAVFKHIKELSNVDSSHVFLHGGSQGGLVAALAAEELADEVRALMLYFPAFNIPYDWTAMHPEVDEIPEVISWWGLDLGREFAVSVHGYKTFEHIGSYSKDVLILYGENDAIVPRSYMDDAKEIYKNCELIVYPNEGHGFTPAGVDTAKQKLLQFMQEHI